ncbi:hypothetical protein R1flu_007054 [Riccia fluitans]|uniref:Uncharacterized protein n=1 Tax=Riccia fluitans TaxID=41844 RepID=A0ABD1YYL5_9MARC
MAEDMHIELSVLTSAELVLDKVGPDEAEDIFTKDLRLENGVPVTEEEMVKLISHSGGNRLVKSGHSIPEEDVAKKEGEHLDNILQKAAEIVVANEKLTQASKPSRASAEQQSEGEGLVCSRYTLKGMSIQSD